MGAVKSYRVVDGDSFESIHRKTIDDVREQLPLEIFNDFVGEDQLGYRRIIYTDSTALQEQMPFYRIRVVYLQLIRLTSAVFSISDAKSVYWLSTSTALLLFGLFALMLSCVRSMSSILVPFVVCIAGY